jgi:hypothetical protein
MPIGAGDKITIYGTGLQGITKCFIFPGNVVVTEWFISDNEKGEFCIVTVPKEFQTMVVHFWQSALMEELIPLLVLFQKWIFFTILTT